MRPFRLLARFDVEGFFARFESGLGSLLGVQNMMDSTETEWATNHLIVSMNMMVVQYCIGLTRGAHGTFYGFISIPFRLKTVDLSLTKRALGWNS